MATRKEISDDIKKQYGSVLNQCDAGKYLNMCKKKVRQFLSDIPSYDTGKNVKYMAIDIAKKIETTERF